MSRVPPLVGPAATGSTDVVEVEEGDAVDPEHAVRVTDRTIVMHKRKGRVDGRAPGRKKRGAFKNHHCTRPEQSTTVGRVAIGFERRGERNTR